MESMADEHLVRQYVESGELRPFDTLVRRHIGKVRAMTAQLSLVVCESLRSAIDCTLLGWWDIVVEGCKSANVLRNSGIPSS